MYLFIFIESSDNLLKNVHITTMIHQKTATQNE